MTSNFKYKNNISKLGYKKMIGKKLLIAPKI